MKPSFLRRLQHTLFPPPEPAWRRALHRVDPRELDWQGLRHGAEHELRHLRHEARQRVGEGREALEQWLGDARGRLTDLGDQLRGQAQDWRSRADGARASLHWPPDLREAAGGVGAAVGRGVDSLRQSLPELRPVLDQARDGLGKAREQLPELQPLFDRARRPLQRAQRHLPAALRPAPPSLSSRVGAELRERWWLYAGLAVGAVVLSESLRRQRQPAGAAPPLASGVDLNRYAGEWAELARYPQVFQSFCPSAKAEYVLAEDGTLRVRNACLDENGAETRSIEGTAEVVDRISNARLEVRFSRWWQSFVPSDGEGNYWIHWVSPDYRFAIVGNRSRSALWLLGRSTEVSAADWSGLLTRVDQLGYDSARLERDAHTWVR